jgi:DNA-binding transcriptional regulator YiaG
MPRFSQPNKLEFRATGSGGVHNKSESQIAAGPAASFHRGNQVNDRERMTKFRARFKLTTEELAKGLGVHERTVRKWEGGERAVPPTVTVLLDVIEANDDARASFLSRCRQSPRSEE